MIKVGEVVAVDEKNCRVRVRLDDCDGMVSYWLPVIVPKSKDDKFYFLPDVGELVVCAFLDYGVEQGFVLGAIYNKKDLPPVSSRDKLHIKFKDGAVMEYDRKENVLKIESRGTLKIAFNSGEITIKSCRAEGEVLEISFNSARLAIKTCQAEGNVLSISHNVMIDGELIVTRNITGMQNVVGANVFSGGVPSGDGLTEVKEKLYELESKYKVHTHVDSEGGNTSPPDPQ